MTGSRDLLIKQALGTLEAPDDLEAALAARRLQPLPITVAHALVAGRLPRHHTLYSSMRRYTSRHRVSCFSQVGGPDDSGLRPGWGLGLSRRCWLASVVASSAS